MKKKSKVFFFALPALLIHGFVVFYPLLSTLFMSLYKWSGVGKARFIGIGNFHQILIEDEIFWISFFNVIKYMAFMLTVPIITGILVAFLVNHAKRGQVFYKIIFFIPVIVASVITSRIWGSLYDPFYGINFIFKNLGLDFLRRSWLGDPSIAIFSVAFVRNWSWWGFVMIFFLAAYQEVDPSYYESAMIDGATNWQQLWHITLPLIRPTLAFIILMTIIWSFAAFDYVWILTQGGPGHGTELLATWIFKKAFITWQTGYASAMSVLLLIFSSIFIFGFIYLRKRKFGI